MLEPSRSSLLMEPLGSSIPWCYPPGSSPSIVRLLGGSIRDPPPLSHREPEPSQPLSPSHNRGFGAELFLFLLLFLPLGRAHIKAGRDRAGHGAAAPGRR